MLDWSAPDEGDPTRISFSHYVDLRGETDEIGSEVVGARWVCVSCHLPANDVPPLVINTFGD
jgi:nitrate reductase cytochrome c-type subunit